MGHRRRILKERISVKWFGAKGDMKEYYVDKNITKHYRGEVNDIILTLTESDLPFTSEDIGKTLVIWTVGVDATRLISTITAVKSPNKVGSDVKIPPSLSQLFVSGKLNAYIQPFTSAVLIYPWAILTSNSSPIVYLFVTRIGSWFGGICVEFYMDSHNKII